jgi:Fe2+ or Zn2+ uptake regulation protein
MDNNKIRETIQEYISKNKMRRTQERKILTDIVCKMKVFKASVLIEEAKKKHISIATAYFFIELLENTGIIIKQESHVFKL